MDVLGRDGVLDQYKARLFDELKRELGAAGKVDAEQKAASRPGHRDDARDDDEQRDEEEEVAAADDVELSHPRLARRRFGLDRLGHDLFRLLGLVLRLFLRLLRFGLLRRFEHDPPQEGPAV